jgi:hypothetical protein
MRLILKWCVQSGDAYFRMCRFWPYRVFSAQDSFAMIRAIEIDPSSLA